MTDIFTGKPNCKLIIKTCSTILLTVLACTIAFLFLYLYIPWAHDLTSPEPASHPDYRIDDIILTTPLYV